MTRARRFGYSGGMKNTAATRATMVLMGAVLAALTLSPGAMADGNRAGAPRLYKGDISPVVAARELALDKNIVLIDVRTVGEFAAAHIDGATSVPYPWIKGFRPEDPGHVAMTDAEFLAAVETLVPNRATPIMTVCSMGMRSARAANILAQAGYSDVRSIWTGVWGRSLTDVENKPLDVNGNGIVGTQALGPDFKPADPGDLDGWAGFHQLPVVSGVPANKVLAKFRDLYPAAGTGK